MGWDWNIVRIMEKWSFMDCFGCFIALGGRREGVLYRDLKVSLWGMSRLG